MKKVAAIHDLSGYGRASLTVAIPILSVMGYQVCPLPTAILSAHSEYAGFRSIDLTGFMQETIAHWKEMHLKFDALYSGYLASTDQIKVVSDFFKDFKSEDNFVVVDPVLGDHKQLYPNMNEQMIEGMRNLCRQANIITPNLTEAAFLLGKRHNTEVSLQEAVTWCKTLSELGPQYVIITSAPSETNRNVGTLAYNSKDRRLWKVDCDQIPASYPGTGDAFASVITGAMLNGDSLPEAVDKAVHFINMGIKATYGYNRSPLDGMNQEKVLHYLTEPLPSYRYKLLEISEND
jgi:pyridoxine kinase